MSVAEAVQTTAKTSSSTTSGLLLQRTCACGGSAGFSGECEECKSKKLLGKPLQRKLVISEPGDEYEHEADRVAEEVMRMSETPADRDASPSSAVPLVQRRVNGSSGGGIGNAPPIVHDVLSLPGQPLDAATRAFFEPRFGHDFENVRVHVDARAAESAQVVKASAYTTGSDIVFGTGQYMPKATEGNRLLAHELAHVVQQSGALTQTQVSPVSNPASVGSTGRLNAGVSTNILTNTEGPVLQRQGLFESFQSGVAGAFESGTEFMESSADAAARAALSVLGTPDPSTIMGLIERALYMPGVGEAILSHSAVAPHRKQIEQLLASQGAFEVVGNFIRNPKAHVDQISQSLVPYVADGQQIAIEKGSDLLAQFEIPPEYRDQVLQIMVPLAGMAKSAFDFVIEEVILDTVLFWQLRSENQIYDAAWENYEKGTIDAFDLIVEHIDIVLNALGRVADLTPLVLAGAGIVAGGAAGGAAGSVVPGAGTAAGSGGGGGVGGGTGLAASEVVGLVLGIAPAVVEGIRGSKAGLEFALKDQNDAQTQQDSGQIAASIIGLAIMAALAFAPGLALRLGKAIGRKLRDFVPDIISKLVSVASSALETATPRRAAALEASSGLPSAGGTTSGKDVPRSKDEAPQREEITSTTSGTDLEDSVKQSSKRENNELTEREKINEVAWVDAHPEVISGSPGQKKATLGEHEIVSVPGVGCQRHSNDPIDIPCPLSLMVSDSDWPKPMSLMVSDSGSPKPIADLSPPDPHSIQPRPEFPWAEPPNISSLDPLPHGTVPTIQGSDGASLPAPSAVAGVPVNVQLGIKARIRSKFLSVIADNPRLQGLIESIKKYPSLRYLTGDYDEIVSLMTHQIDDIAKRIARIDATEIGKREQLTDELLGKFRIRTQAALERVKKHPAAENPELNEVLGKLGDAYLFGEKGKEKILNLPKIVGEMRTALNDPARIADAVNVIEQRRRNLADASDDLAESYREAVISIADERQIPVKLLWASREGKKVAMTDRAGRGRKFKPKELQTGYVLTETAFTKEVVGSEAWVIDESALQFGKDHGAITHIIQDLVVDRVLERYKLTAIEFRTILKHLDVEGGRRGSKIWLETYDIVTPETTLSRPEIMWSAIREVIGIRKGDL